MVGRRVGMLQGWLLGEGPDSDKKKCLHGRQATCEEKARHVHCGPGLFDGIVAALVARSNVVCDGSIGGLLFTFLNDSTESEYLDDFVDSTNMIVGRVFRHM